MFQAWQSVFQKEVAGAAVYIFVLVVRTELRHSVVVRDRSLIRRAALQLVGVLFRCLAEVVVELSVWIAEAPVERSVHGARSYAVRREVCLHRHIQRMRILESQRVPIWLSFRHVDDRLDVVVECRTALSEALQDRIVSGELQSTAAEQPPVDCYSQLAVELLEPASERVRAQAEKLVDVEESYPVVFPAMRLDEAVVHWQLLSWTVSCLELQVRELRRDAGVAPVVLEHPCVGEPKLEVVPQPLFDVVVFAFSYADDRSLHLVDLPVPLSLMNVMPVYATRV